MRNTVIGSVFFILLLFGFLFGLLCNQLELFTFLALLLGLTTIIIFRKKER